MQTKTNNNLIEQNLLNTNIKSAYYILNKKEWDQTLKWKQSNIINSKQWK